METEMDVEAEAADTALTAAEEAEANEQFAMPPGPVGDLTDGGKVGGVTVQPSRGWGEPRPKKGEPLKGRPAVRRAWMWNGTETMLLLGWKPDGKVHDGARPYLLKRTCLCCMTSGFKAVTGQPARCPKCIRNGCDRCGGSTEPAKIIRTFYLRKDEVPFQEKFYGAVDCFLPHCPRREGHGFQNETDMRLHAMGRHRMEYRAYQESKAATQHSEIADLRTKLDALLLNPRAAPVPVTANGSVKPKRDGWAKARAAKVAKAEAKQKERVAQPT